MIWIILGTICVIVLAAEAVFVLPDKMPWNKKKGAERDAGKR